MRKTTWMLASMLCLAAGAVRAEGSSDGPSWARWQGRFSLGSAPGTALRGAGDTTAAPAKYSSASLMGDYYFGRPVAHASQLGGFRATSGLMFGSRSTLNTGQPGLATGSAFNVGSRAYGQNPAAIASESAADTATVPYLGIGYTGLSVRNGWSFNADLGLFGQNAAAAARLGHGTASSQSLDDAVRQMRMTPLLQLGAAYTF